MRERGDLGAMNMEIRDKRIFITGGGGFIGSHVCERLVDANRITVYDNGIRDALSYTALLRHPNLTFVRGDVLDKSLLFASARGAEIVIHLAAIAGVSSYYSHPVETMRTNVIGTSHLLEAAREIRPELFVYFSTSEVYGSHAAGARESDETTLGAVKVARWTYAVSKLAGEHLSFAFFREHGLPVVSIRPFNIYGPRQVGEGAVRIFAAAALKGETITIHNDGRQIRAWCHIDDLMDGLMACLSRKAAVGEAFNLGNPAEPVNALGLAERIVGIVGSQSSIVHASHEPAGDIRERVPNIEKAEEILGFKPAVSLADGLAGTINWYRGVLCREG
jgi:UDP-glucose 4-epimerase